MSDNEHDSIREKLRECVRRGDRSGYELLYASADFDGSKVPWADFAPNRNVTRWLDREEVRAEGRKALVVGCGLGDDAEELARRGFDVTAFDISPTAIEWCRRRFPNSPVNYSPADLLSPPSHWHGAFDFILEVYTLQAMSLEHRRDAIQSLARFVARGGGLLIVCRGRDVSDPPGDLPFPLLRAELDELLCHGLRNAGFEDYLDDESPPARRFRAYYIR